MLVTWYDFLCHSDVTSLPPLYRYPLSIAWLRVRVARYTFLFSLAWSWRMKSLVKHNMLKITLWKIGRARGPRQVSETGNDVPWKHKHAVLHCYWSGQPRGKECRPPRPPPSAYLLSTTHSKDVRFPWVTLYSLYADAVILLSRYMYSMVYVHLLVTVQNKK